MFRKMTNLLGFCVTFAALSALIVKLSDLLMHYVNEQYISDYPVHLKTVVEGQRGYSLVHRLFGICFKCANPYGMIAWLMTLMTVLTFCGISIYIIKRTDVKVSDCRSYLVALGVLFTSNIYVPSLFPHLYNHYTTVSQPLHNSTYTCMRLFSVFVIILFFDIYDKVRDGKFPPIRGILFCVVLTLCNSAKPSFFLAFAPMALISFIYLFIKSRGRNILSLLEWGICFIISAPIIYFMAQIVYAEENEVDSVTSATVAISPEELIDFFAGGSVCIYELSNLLFPLFVLVVFIFLAIRKKTECNRIVWGFVLYVVAHMEQLLLVDGDDRASDGNFAWGVYNVGMILSMICITEWIRAYKMGKIHNKALFGFGFVLFILQSVCGIIYFVTVCRGGSYLI